MFSLPTFLSFPFSLPFLPSISLPTNIQQRFLSYGLKRALGRFFRSGLDEDKIQSQIGEGKVEIEGLIVDEEVGD
jgi:autophagy-related protein 2